MSKHDGGPAFPYIPIDHGGFQSGTSLRDDFAAAALQGMLSHGQEYMQNISTYIPLAYQYADAMLAEREK